MDSSIKIVGKVVSEEELEEHAKFPRIRPEDLDNEIVDVKYVGGDPEEGNPASLLTFCILTLKNGFTVTGQSVCAHPKNFNKEFGERIAFQDAKLKIYPLLAFRLRDSLSHSEKTPIEKVQIELCELKIKIRSLSFFIGSETFYTLDKRQRELLTIQLDQMEAYANTLQLRILNMQVTG